MRSRTLPKQLRVGRGGGRVRTRGSGACDYVAVGQERSKRARTKIPEKECVNALEWGGWARGVGETWGRSPS